MLADGEPIHVQRVMQEAVDAGFSAHSIERAAKDLGIVKRKVGRPGQQGQQWTWALPPEGGHEVPKAATPGGWRSSGKVPPIDAGEPPKGPVGLAEGHHDAPKATSPEGWCSSGEVAFFEAGEPPDERAR